MWSSYGSWFITTQPFCFRQFWTFWCIVFIRILYCMIRKFATSGSSNFYIQQLFHFMFISLKKKISYIIQYHEFKLVTTHMRLWFNVIWSYMSRLKHKNVGRRMQQRPGRYSSQRWQERKRKIYSLPTWRWQNANQWKYLLLLPFLKKITPNVRSIL